MEECPKISISINISCNQAKQQDAKTEEYFWPLDELTTFDFSIIPVTQPEGWPAGGASFRVEVPAKIPTTADAPEKNTAEGVGANVAKALNARLAGTGVTVTSKSGGVIPAGQSHAGDPLVVLEFDCVKGVDAAWDYSKIHGVMWGTPGTSAPGQPPPPVPMPFYPPTGGKWPGWLPDSPEATGKKKKRPGVLPKTPHQPEPKKESRATSLRTTALAGTPMHGSAWKRLVIGIHVGPPRDSGFLCKPAGWCFREYFFPATASEEEVARTAESTLRDLDIIRPLFFEYASLTGVMWGVDAADGVVPGRLHYELLLDPPSVRPVLEISPEVEGLAQAVLPLQHGTKVEACPPWECCCADHLRSEASWVARMTGRVQQSVGPGVPWGAASRDTVPSSFESRLAAEAERPSPSAHSAFSQGQSVSMDQALPPGPFDHEDEPRRPPTRRLGGILGCVAALVLLSACRDRPDSLHPACPRGMGVPSEARMTQVPRPTDVPIWARVSREQLSEAERMGVPVAFENLVGMQFVLIPRGTFTMGSLPSEESRDEDESPAHEVSLSRSYYLQTTEVTNLQYRRFKSDHDSAHPDGASLNGDQQPVVQVTWEDAQAFINWLELQDQSRDYRLPTEAEWERACRAGTSTPFLWGSSISTDRANYDGSTVYGGGVTGINRKATVPVATLPASPWGLFEVHGNVREWCADWFGDYPNGEVVDPPGPQEGTSRVVRGGSWANAAYALRSACRYSVAPAEYRAYIGFRVAVSVTPRTK